MEGVKGKEVTTGQRFDHQGRNISMETPWKPDGVTSFISDAN
jgi:hypothetical protein